MTRKIGLSKLDSYQGQNLIMRARSASIQIELAGHHALGCSHEATGYASSTESLEVNAIWITSEDASVMLVSIDAMYVGATIRKFAEALFAEELMASQIFFGASHTHNAPNLDSSKPGLMAHSALFIEQTKRGLIELRKSLLQQQWKPVSVHESSHSFVGAVSRRKMPHTLMTFLRPFRAVALMLPNAKGTPKLEGKLIQFRTEEKTLSSIYISPCHPVGFPVANVVSPDYVGHLRKVFRENPQVAHPKAAFVFFQGAAGDIRPLALSNEPPNSVRAMVFKLLNGPVFGRFSKNEYVNWCESLTPGFLSAVENVNPSEASMGKVRTFRKTRQISRFPFLQPDSARVFSMQILRFGRIQILGVSAEVTNQLGTALQSLLPSSSSLVSCIDDTFGYLAHPNQVTEGGYEVDGWLKPFGVSGGYDPDKASRWLLNEVQNIAGNIEYNLADPEG